MRAIAAAAGLWAFALTGCATLPPPPPTSVDHGLLVARARVLGAILSFTSDLADRAEIEQIDANGDAIPGKVAVAGYARGGYVYFTDLPPGRYALTAVSFPARGTRYGVPVPPAKARQNTVELRAGEAAFLGDLTFAGRAPDLDVAFERMLDVFGRWLTPWVRRPPLPRDADLFEFYRASKDEVAAMLAARKGLAGTPWRKLTEARLRALHAPEPAAREGLILRADKPFRPEPAFSWRDTLGWGEPRRAPNGAVWRKPKSTAQVAVFFTSADAPGFAGYDEALRQMRQAAGALDDPARTYEVRVGTYTGVGARATSHAYPVTTLTGSQVTVTVTESVLVDYPGGMYTVRLRAERGEFEKLTAAFHEFLLQLKLGPPSHADEKPETFIPL